MNLGCSREDGNTKSAHTSKVHFEQSCSLGCQTRHARWSGQAGPGAGAALVVTPSNRETSPCGRPLDPCGHHRAACAQAGMLGRRGYALESIMARICREAGGRVRTNMLVRDMDVQAPLAGRQSPSGGRRGRFASERWRAGCGGHHIGLRFAPRRCPSTGSGRQK